jgi:hypothetical protein
VSEAEHPPTAATTFSESPRRGPWALLPRGLAGGLVAGLGAMSVSCLLELTGCGGLASFGFLLLSLACVAAVGVLSLLALTLAETRPVGLAVLAGCLVAAATIVLAGPVTHRCRSFAFARLAERSEPLVAAIHAYKVRHGAAPSELRDLVPEFLEEVPGTGMPSYPFYKYERVENLAAGQRAWRLWVDCSCGPLDFDNFSYRPAGDPGLYDDDPYTRHGDWIYWDE